MFNMLFTCSLDVLCLHRVLSNVLTMWLRGVCRDHSICSCNVIQMLSLETWKVALGESEGQLQATRDLTLSGVYSGIGCVRSSSIQPRLSLLDIALHL